METNRRTMARLWRSEQAGAGTETGMGAGMSRSASTGAGTGAMTTSGVDWAKAEALWPLRELSLAELDDPAVPEVEWVVEGLLPRGALALLLGQPKVGKSLLALDLAASVALGERFLGRATRQGPALYVAAEDAPAVLRSRLRARLGTAREVPLAVIPTQGVNHQAPLRIDQAASLGQLLKKIQALKPAVVVLDPLRELHGLDENDARKMVDLIAALRILTRTTRALMVVTHHRAKRGTVPSLASRGSTAISGAVDVVLSLERRGWGRAITNTGRGAKTGTGRNESAADDVDSDADMGMDMEMDTDAEVDATRDEETEAVRVGRGGRITGRERERGEDGEEREREREGEGEGTATLRVEGRYGPRQRIELRLGRELRWEAREAAGAEETPVRERVRECLARAAGALTAVEVRRVAGGSRSNVQEALRGLVAAGEAAREGAGTPRAPYRYRRV